MTAKKRATRQVEVVPRREVVEVFKLLQLDQPDELKRLEELGGFGRMDEKPPTYYTIEVSGSIEYSDCALSL